MTYHINMDGKIMPCRAKIKACPYSAARHSDDYGDLLYKYQDTYNTVPLPKGLVDRLSKGYPLNNLGDIDEEIATSTTPIELITTTLKFAIETAGAGNVSEEDEAFYEHIVGLCADYLTAGEELPEKMPLEVKKLAHTKKKGLSEFRKYSKLVSDYVYDPELYGSVDRMIRIQRQYDEMPQITGTDKQNYVNALKETFYYWAKILNVRKLINQSILDVSSPEAIEKILPMMTTSELQSIYDDCILSDRELVLQLTDIDNFDFGGYKVLSEAANNNLYKWLDSAKEAKNYYIVGSAGRTLTALYISKELDKRHAKYTDLVYTVNE